MPTQDSKPGGSPCGIDSQILKTVNRDTGTTLCSLMEISITGAEPCPVLRIIIRAILLSSHVRELPHLPPLFPRATRKTEIFYVSRPLNVKGLIVSPTTYYATEIVIARLHRRSQHCLPLRRLNAHPQKGPTSTSRHANLCTRRLDCSNIVQRKLRPVGHCIMVSNF